MAKPFGADVKRRSKTPNEIFGRTLTHLRTKEGQSQASLAAALGYSTYYIGKIERGKANISCDVMAAVASHFKMTIGQFWLYGEKLAKSASTKV